MVGSKHAAFIYNVLYSFNGVLAIFVHTHVGFHWLSVKYKISGLDSITSQIFQYFHHCTIIGTAGIVALELYSYKCLIG